VIVVKNVIHRFMIFDLTLWATVKQVRHFS